MENDTILINPKQLFDEHKEKIKDYYFNKFAGDKDNKGKELDLDIVYDTNIFEVTKIWENFSYVYRRYSRLYKDSESKVLLMLYTSPVNHSLERLWEWKAKSNKTFSKEEKNNFEILLCQYIFAREIYLYLLWKEKGIDVFSEQEDNKRLLSALQRFFAISYIENEYGANERDKFLNLLNDTLEFETKLSMFHLGDKLFYESISSVAGERTNPRDMSVYKNLIGYCTSNKYQEGVDYLIKSVSLSNKRFISNEEYEAYKEKYHPDRIKRKINDGSESDISELEKNALLFIWEDCGLFEHTYPDRYTVDDGLLCLYQAIHEFMESGSKYNAIDIYNCYCRCFLKGDKMQEFINMISSYENNASRLVQSHRDHYSHSVYVFILGLAIYHTNPDYRSQFANVHFGSFRLCDIEDKEKPLDLDLIDYYCGKESGQGNFLRLWGMTALFHDIGYQFEIPFEQIKTTTNGKIIYQYEGFDEFNKFDNYIGELEENDKTGFFGSRQFENIEEYKKRLFLFDKSETVPKDCSFEDIIAYHIVRLLKDRKLSLNDVSGMLKRKVSPVIDKPYMDHAYFSGILLFRQLLQMLGLDEFRVEYMDAITAIVMHNKFFEIMLKKDGGPMKMEEHPLAFLLILCDELQCWDRTSFGKKSIAEDMHPIDARFKFDSRTICVDYIFDQRYLDSALHFDETGKINKVSGGTIKKIYIYKKSGKENIVTPNTLDSNDKSTYIISSKDFKDGEKCKFASDIAEIVKIDIDEAEAGNTDGNTPVLTVRALFGERDKYRFESLSETSMRNLYSTARSMYEKIKDDNFEYADLRDKLMYISFVRDMGEGLNRIHCFYINEAKALRIVESASELSEEEISVITGYEKERIEIFCETHMLPKLSDDGIQEMVKSCINEICESRGVELYRL